MVAASMGVIIVSAILSLSSKTLWILEEIKASSEVLEQGQYLSGLLSREITMAGFYGDFDYAMTAIISTTSPPTICQSVSKKNIIQAMPYPLIGIDNIKEGYKLCGGEIVLTGTDVILLRRTSVKKQSPRYRLKSQQMYVQSSFDTADPIIDQGNNATAFKLKQGSKPAPVKAWQQTLYYLSKDKVFKRRRYINGKYARAEPLVDGIEDFQIEYGIAKPLGSFECHVDYLTPPLTADQWQRVVAVRFNILARSAWRGVSHRGRQFTYANKIYEIDEGGYYQLFKVLVPIMNKLPNKLQFDIEK